MKNMNDRVMDCIKDAKHRTQNLDDRFRRIEIDAVTMMSSRTYFDKLLAPVGVLPSELTKSRVAARKLVDGLRSKLESNAQKASIFSSRFQYHELTDLFQTMNLASPQYTETINNHEKICTTLQMIINDESNRLRLDKYISLMALVITGSFLVTVVAIITHLILVSLYS
jgi:hypothetical protein